jgi:hypothetical protein
MNYKLQHKVSKEMNLYLQFVEGRLATLIVPLDGHLLTTSIFGLFNYK